jgi:hypothetical protein
MSIEKTAAYVITTQNLEEYGENFHKFKGGSEYVVHYTITDLVYEENAYGEGSHSYYESPSLTRASACALVMQHVNRYNGLRGSFDYITDVQEGVSIFDTPDHPTFNGHKEDLVSDLQKQNPLFNRIDSRIQA